MASTIRPALVLPGPAEAHGKTGEVCPKMSTAMMFGCGACGQSYAIPVGCGRLSCWSCEADVASKRAERKFNLIGGDGVHLGAFVFTLPYIIGQQLGADGAKELRKRIANLLEVYYLERWGGLTGSIIALHPEGDNRRGKWQPHYHAVVPLLGMDSAGKLSALPHFLVDAELDAFKLRWLGMLRQVARELGCSEDQVNGLKVNLHYSYIDGGDSPDEGRRDRARAKKLHRLRYDLRPFPAWSAGDLNRTRLLSPSSFGLLSGRADKLAGPDRMEALSLWRECLQGPELVEPESTCTARVDGGVVCGCTLTPLGMAAGPTWRVEERFPGVVWRTKTLGDQVKGVAKKRGRAPPRGS